MTISEIIQDQYGPQTANGYDRLASQCFWAYNEAFEAGAYSLFSKFHPNHPKKLCVLDVGAGTGNGSLSITEKLNFIQSQIGLKKTEFSITLFDQSAPMLKKAEEKLLGLISESIVSPVEFLSQRIKAHFDLVLSSYFYHNLDVEKKIKFLNSVFEKIQPGGSFLLVDRFCIDKENTFGTPDYLKVYTTKFFFDAKVFNSQIEFDSVQTEIQKNFEFENDSPADLMETIELLKSTGFTVANPFLSFGIGVLHATKPVSAI